MREAGRGVLHERLGRLAAAVLTHCHGSRETVQNAQEVFEGLHSRESKRFLALCLLRVAGDRADAFDDASFRVPAIKLFDDVFAADLYPLFDIPPKAQGHEKIALLSSIAPGAFREAVAAVRTLTPGSDFGKARTALLKTLKARRVAPLIVPFVTRDLADRELQEVMAKVAEFDEAEDERLVEAHAAAVESIDDFLGAAREIETDYAEAIYVELGTRLESWVADRYASTGATEPADVSATLSNKKYPVHISGAEFRLLVDVRNRGPGMAFETRVTVESDERLEVLQETVELGPLAARDVRVPFPVRVPASDSAGIEAAPAVLVRVEWRNATGEQQHFDSVVDLPAQNPSVDWDSARRSDPYALEPVTNEEELIGRDSILDSLESMVTSAAVGSLVLRGQKRVGKTSIVRTLESRLASVPNGPAVAYLEVGPYGGESVRATVAALAPEICRVIDRALQPAEALPIPDFREGSLAPLIGYADRALELSSRNRLLLVLDEFDELPYQLFGPDELARSFFNTLRALTNKSALGIFLIGGEKMEFALALHGDVVNKFREERVDFVALENNFGDFSSLVRLPVRDVLDIEDGAISALHAETSGHPYFTKMICRTLWESALASRDAHVTSTEVAAAVDETLVTASTSSFQHFWSDGIRGSAEEQAAYSLERRKFFVALAEALRRGSVASEEAVVEEGLRLGMTRGQVSAFVKESLGRELLIQQGKDAYRVRIPFFGKWLAEHGPAKIGAQLSGSDVLDGLRKRDEELRVKAAEIKEVASRWGTYQGSLVTPEDVRAWLEQFIGARNQRLMFSILEGLRFYSGPRIKEALQEGHAAVVRGSRGEAALRQTDVVVSYLDGAGKSGPEMARSYRSANAVPSDNILELSELGAQLERIGPSTVVFVDDFVATGSSVAEGLDALAPEIVAYLKRPKIRVGFVCVAGFDTGLQTVERAFKDIGVRARVVAGDTLTDADRCFHVESTMFGSEEDRVVAEEIAAREGAVLDKRQPLGYDNSQAAVVFQTHCPNNTIPILWASKGSWRPLFPRR